MFRGMTLCEAEERREAKSKEVECLMAMSLMNRDWIGGKEKSHFRKRSTRRESVTCIVAPDNLGLRDCPPNHHQNLHNGDSETRI